MVCKVAAMAAGFHKRVILHGSMGTGLAGWLQASAAVDAEWQEVARSHRRSSGGTVEPGLGDIEYQDSFPFRDGEIKFLKARASVSISMKKPGAVSCA